MFSSAGLLFVLSALLASAVCQLLFAGGRSMFSRALSGQEARLRTTTFGGCVIVLRAGVHGQPRSRT